jgi:hypothetical protein
MMGWNIRFIGRRCRWNVSVSLLCCAGPANEGCPSQNFDRIPQVWACFSFDIEWPPQNVAASSVNHPRNPAPLAIALNAPSIVGSVTRKFGQTGFDGRSRTTVEASHDLFILLKGALVFVADVHQSSDDTAHRQVVRRALPLP